MEVFGRKGELSDIHCQPCEDDGKLVAANGLCKQCSEHMCTACFVRHKKVKVARNHVMGDIDVTQISVARGSRDIELEYCSRHPRDMIKFFCPSHDKTGCSDCMVLDHASCKKDYIPDLVEGLCDSQMFKSFSKLSDACQDGLRQIQASLSDKKVQINETYGLYASDVENFRDLIIEYINNHARQIIEEAKEIRDQDLKTLEELNQEATRLQKEATSAFYVSQIVADKPGKAFHHIVQKKGVANTINEDVRRLQRMIDVKKYEFRQNDELKSVLSDANSLGKLHQPSTSDESGEFIRLSTSDKRNNCSVLQTTEQEITIERLLLRNIEQCIGVKVYRQFLSYDNDVSADVRVYSLKRPFHIGSSFSVLIVDAGAKGTIAVGVNLEYYSYFGGFRCKTSTLLQFHADDGKLYRNNAKPFGSPCQVSDIITCRVVGYETMPAIEFLKNGAKMGRVQVQTDIFALHFSVAFHSEGEKVKVTEVFDNSKLPVEILETEPANEQGLQERALRCEGITIDNNCLRAGPHL